MSRHSSSDEDVGVLDVLAGMEFELSLVSGLCQTIRTDEHWVRLTQLVRAVEGIQESAKKLASELATAKRIAKATSARRRMSALDIARRRSHGDIREPSFTKPPRPK